MRYMAKFEVADADRRSTSRFDLKKVARIMVRSRHVAQDVLIDNLSTHGFMVMMEGGEAFVGRTISVELQSIGARAAVVHWQSDGRVGCAFEAPLSSDELALVRAREVDLQAA